MTADDEVFHAAQFAKQLTALGRRQVIDNMVWHDPSALLDARDRLRAAIRASRIPTEGT